MFFLFFLSSTAPHSPCNKREPSNTTCLSVSLGAHNNILAQVCIIADYAIGYNQSILKAVLDLVARAMLNWWLQNEPDTSSVD